MTGFTGIIWDTRTTTQLAADLGSGAGPAPVVAAGAAWAHLADELGTAAIEYTAVLTALGDQWQSTQTDEMFATLRQLTGWLTDAALAAAANGARAEAHAAAVTVARLAMPNAAEIDLADSAVDAASVVTAIAPTLIGASAVAEQAVHDQRLRAARVMQTYEAATEPVARVWPGVGPAPELVSGSPLAAERAARVARTEAQRATVDPPSTDPRSTGPTTHPVVYSSPAPAVLPSMPGGTTTPTGPVLRPAPTIPAAASSSVAPPATPTSAPAAAPATPPAPLVGQVGGVAAERVVTRGPQATPDPGAEIAVAAADADAVDRWHLGWAELADADRPMAQHVSGLSANPYGEPHARPGTDDGEVA